MNMHSIVKTPFDKLNHEIAKAYKVSATKSMIRAAEEYTNTTLEPTKKRAKFDGAWQKRGHASLNGYISAVVGNKYVVVEAQSTFCRGCKMWEKRERFTRIYSMGSITVTLTMSNHQVQWKV